MAVNECVVSCPPPNRTPLFAPGQALPSATGTVSAEDVVGVADVVEYSSVAVRLVAEVHDRVLIAAVIVTMLLSMLGYMHG